MSSISGVSGGASNYYGQIASGRRINSAADGAAELSISSELDRTANGYDAGGNNIQSAQDMLKTADGAQSRITDYLQRIRELALGASNDAVVSDDERRMMQDEVDQLKQGISEIADQTMFNTKKLLDGSHQDFSLATDANGNKATVSIGQSTLKSLGIEDFDLTKEFDINAIDEAIQTVSAARGSAGSQSNGMEYAYNFSTQASYNATSSSSKLEDLDYPQAVSEKKKKETLQAYALLMEKKKQEDEDRKMQNFFTNTNLLS